MISRFWEQGRCRKLGIEGSEIQAYAGSRGLGFSGSEI